DVRSDAKADVVRVGGCERAEYVCRWRAQIDDDLGRSDGQALAGANVERYPAPAPGVDRKPQGRERFDARIGGDPRLLVVALELAAHESRRIERADRAKYFDLLIAQRIAREAHRRLHREEGNDLQHVVLDHIPDRAGLVVEASAPC